MSMDGRAWRCGVCGYVHRGNSVPDFCPICGASAADFEPHQETERQVESGTPKQWRCLNCNYVHEGSTPPELCPICGVGANEFGVVSPTVTTEGSSGSGGSIAIIGAGIAGVAAAEMVRRSTPDANVTLLSREGVLPYYRLNLTRYLAREIAADTLPIHPEGWYAEHRIDVRSGVDVVDLGLGEGSVVCRDGTRVPYDRLIIATGAHPFVPPVEGAKLGNVFTLRTAADAEGILASVQQGGACVVIGGGVLGLETAGALAGAGVQVSLLESHEWLMPRQLNRRAAERLEEYLGALGVALLKTARTEAIEGTATVEGVVLEDGRRLPAQNVIFATGVRPNSHLARTAGLECRKGIIVNSTLTTSEPSVFAAGDVAEHNGVLYGTWAASQYQGGIAGMNAAGVRTDFGGLARANALKVLSIDLLSVGRFEPQDGSDRVIDLDEDGRYCRFVFTDARLTGAVLMGAKELGTAVRDAVETQRDFSGVLAHRPRGTDIIAALQER